MEGGQPRIVDLPYKLLEDGDYPAHQLDFRPVLGRVASSWTRIDIPGFGVGRPLGHRLSLIHNDNFIADGCPVNECV